MPVFKEIGIFYASLKNPLPLIAFVRIVFRNCNILKWIAIPVCLSWACSGQCFTPSITTWFFVLYMIYISPIHKICWSTCINPCSFTPLIKENFHPEGPYERVFKRNILVYCFCFNIGIFCCCQVRVHTGGLHLGWYCQRVGNAKWGYLSYLHRFNCLDCRCCSSITQK